MEIRPVGVQPLPQSVARKPAAEAPLDQVSLGQTPLPEGGRPRGGSLTGDIRSHKVHSTVLGQDRKIMVYLPPGYEANPDKHYPVAYTCDGASMFDRRTATRHIEWGLDEAAESLIRQGKLDEVILVAVANGGSGESRREDYAPASDARYGGGQAARYLSFLKDELKPMVDATYRTRREAASTAIMGSSLGGLFSLYAGFAAPQTFGLVGALSPSIWYAGKDIVGRLDHHGPDKVYVDMGTRESNPDWSLDPVSEFKEVQGVLTDHGYLPGQTLLGSTVEGAEHTNQAWSERVGDVLVALFPPPGGSGAAS